MILDDSAIVAELLTRVKAAWPDTVKVFTEPPRTPGRVTDLPRAFCIVSNVSMSKSGPVTGKESQQEWTYQITRQAQYPTAGTLHAEKLRQSTSLVSSLTSDRRLLGWKRDIMNVDFGDTETETGKEPVYTITVSITIFVVSNS